MDLNLLDQHRVCRATKVNSSASVVTVMRANGFSGLTSSTFVGDGAGLTNLSGAGIEGGLTTNVDVLVPGGRTNTLWFTNGLLRAVQ